jgi:hypothetical protein
VTFWNRIKRGLIKICKVVPLESQDALGTTQFPFAYTVNGGPPIFAGTAANGECILVPDSYPILQANGNQTVIQVQEYPSPFVVPPGVVVTDITYSGPGTPQGSNLCGRSITYLLGAGVNITTFKNQKGVPGPAC